jgi:hypothetical protein
VKVEQTWLQLKNLIQGQSTTSASRANLEHPPVFVNDDFSGTQTFTFVYLLPMGLQEQQ